MTTRARKVTLCPSLRHGQYGFRLHWMEGRQDPKRLESLWFADREEAAIVKRVLEDGGSIDDGFVRVAQQVP